MPTSSPTLEAPPTRSAYVDRFDAHAGTVVPWLVTSTVTRWLNTVARWLNTEQTGWNSIEATWVSTPGTVDYAPLSEFRQTITGDAQHVWWVVREFFAPEESETDHFISRGLVLHPVGWERPPAAPRRVSAPARNDVASSPAARLRELTGLDAGRLAEVFGVSRIAYQGWLGEVQPALARREHLLEVLALTEEAWQRLGSTSAVRDWLLTPVRAGGPKPLDLLRERRYDAARGFLLRGRLGTETVRPLGVRPRRGTGVSEDQRREALEILNPRYGEP